MMDDTTTVHVFSPITVYGVKQLCQVCLLSK